MLLTLNVKCNFLFYRLLLPYMLVFFPIYFLHYLKSKNIFSFSIQRPSFQGLLIRLARDGAVVKSLACGQNLQANQKESSIEASPSTYVPRIQTPVSTPYVVCRRRVCGWFSPLLREVFLRVLRFSPLLKIQHFQIQIRPGIRWPKNHYC